MIEMVVFSELQGIIPENEKIVKKTLIWTTITFSIIAKNYAERPQISTLKLFRKLNLKQGQVVISAIEIF